MTHLVIEQIKFRRGTALSIPVHEQIRQILIEAGTALALILPPDSAETTLAMRKIQEAGFYANLTVALALGESPEGDAI